MFGARRNQSHGDDNSDASSATTILANARNWNFDIDKYLNRFVPAPRWRLVPYPVAHLLGHRKGHVERIGNIPMIFWAFVGIFSAILLIELATRSVPFVQGSQLIIVASFVSPALGHMSDAV